MTASAQKPMPVVAGEIIDLAGSAVVYTLSILLGLLVLVVRLIINGLSADGGFARS